MPAIGNYTGATNLTVEYQFAGSQPHHLSYSSHILRQTCTLWNLALKLQIVISAFVMGDTIRHYGLIDLLKQSTLTSYPADVVDRHPLSYLFLSILNSVGYVSFCTADNIYSARSERYKTDFQLALEKDQKHCEAMAFRQLLVGNEKLLSTSDQLLSNFGARFFHVPHHTFVFSPCHKEGQFEKLLNSIKENPEYLEILRSTNITEVEYRLKKLVHDYTAPLFAQPKVHKEL